MRDNEPKENQVESAGEKVTFPRRLNKESNTLTESKNALAALETEVERLVKQYEETYDVHVSSILAYSPGRVLGSKSKRTEKVFITAELF